MFLLTRMRHTSCLLLAGLAMGEAFCPTAVLPARAGITAMRMDAREAHTPIYNRADALRTIGLASILATSASAPRPAFADGEAASGEDSGQVIDLDEITFNPKKAAIVGGAFVFADVVSALLTGRSVLRIINGNEDPEDWKTKAVNKLLEKEKAEQAAKMGVSVTTNSEKKTATSSSGDYAKSDPFEIAKERYKKPPSIEDLKKNVRAQLDKDDDDE